MSNANDADLDFIAQAMPAFISEAAEQIEAIETLLLELEEQPDNRELLDSLFRCAHTVKGSAGIFGLNRVVEFTHHVETLLDKMRDGDIALNPDISTLLLQCNDQIKFLVDTAADEAADTAEQKDARADLVIRLKSLTDGNATAAAEPIAATTKVDAGDGALKVWSISARFGPETFRNGMDPLSIARYLATIGTVKSVRCGTDSVPPLMNLNPESCYLSFFMELETATNREEIEGAFSFVIDDCELDVVAPETAGQKMARAIEEMPETPRLGDMLVQVGAVSQDKLAQVLSTQQHTPGMPAVAKAKIGDLLESQAGVAPEVAAAALGKQQKSVKPRRLKIATFACKRTGWMRSSICWAKWSLRGLVRPCSHERPARLP